MSKRARRCVCVIGVGTRTSGEMRKSLAVMLKVTRRFRVCENKE